MPGDNIGYPAVYIGFQGYIAIANLADSARIQNGAFCALAIIFVNIQPFDQAALGCEQFGDGTSIAFGFIRRADTGYCCLLYTSPSPRDA